MIDLESFNLVIYNDKHVEHRTVVANLFNDEDTRKYLGDVIQFIDNIKNATDEYSNIYIVYYNDEPIGIVSLYFLGKKYEICYALLPEYRGKHIATPLLKEFTSYVFNITNINDLYLYINKENNNSIKVALNNNYKKNNMIEYQKSR